MLMDLDEVKQSILKWMENFLEVEHPALGKWAPCPYARKARLDGRIDIRLGIDPYDDLIALAKEGIGDKEVVVLAYDPQLYSADEYEIDIVEGNAAIKEYGLISLSDHPNSPEEVNGVEMNHGEYALSIVAPVANLDDASKKLYRAGYYDTWKESYMDDVFTGRKDPRES
jgi:hypothetical protein